MIVYEFLSPESVREEDTLALSRLLEQLLGRPVALDHEHLRRVVREARVLVAWDDVGRVVGTGSLWILGLLHGAEARIEEVVVDEARRGQGIGREIMRRLLEEARTQGVGKILLTSKPARADANQLYLALGFERYETNVYKMVL